MTSPEDRLARVVRYVLAMAEKERRSGRKEHEVRTIALVVEAMANGYMDGGGEVVPVEPVLERLGAAGVPR